MIQKHINYLQYQLLMQKKNREIPFHPAAPVLKYHQKLYNSCCLSSLASDFHIVVDNTAITVLVTHIKESFTPYTDKFNNIILFYNAIMNNIVHIKGEQLLRYNLKL